MAGVVCSQCGFESEKGAIDCTHCGAPLERVCPVCSAAVPASFAFCGRCGARVSEPAPVGLEHGDRRTVTVLFADLSGFTALAEQLDPEDLTALINECFGALGEEVRARDGWLEKQIGDALVAVFGAPLVHEDDPLRAVRAGWAMHERMRELNDRLAPRLGRALQLHIGVNTGLVVMGPGLEGAAEGSGSELVVLGDAVNVGARLQQAAKAGQLLVGEATYAASASAFHYRRLPPLQVKGKQERLTAYECLGPRAYVADAGRVGSPLVGRAAELAAVQASLERLDQGEGGLLLVVGEAGLGKSRLMAEAHRRLPASVRWLEGRALSFGQMISYFPFIEILKSDAGIGEEEAEAVSFQKLERRLSELVRDEQVPEILPYLAVLLSLDVPGELAERVRYLDGEAMRHQIFRATRLYTEALSRERPTALVFEDFHWADASSEALLEHLLPLVASVPLLICCPTRAEPETPGARLREHAAAYAERTTEIVLSPLSRAEATDLVRNLIEIDLAPRLREIFAKTEGNPFFLEEVVRSLIELGVIDRNEQSGRWEVVADLDEISIPDTVQGVIIARIDRLDEEAKQVLRTASVIGRRFFYPVLRSLTERDRSLDSRLSELEQLELIRERRVATELEYIFKNALTQEAVYESILLRRRRELHGRVARSIESLFAERLEEFYALLAFHYAHAEDWERAQEYLFKAGDQAGKLAADAEALTHYRHALAAHARVFGESWDPLERAVLERKIGEALFRRGENDDALEHLHRSLGYLGRSVPTTRVGVRIGIMRELLRQIGYRLLPSVFLRKLPQAPGPRDQELAHIYETMGWIHYFSDQESLLLDGLSLANVSERSNYGFGMVSGWIGLGFALDVGRLHRLAERYDRRALALLDRMQHPAAVGFANFGFGFHEHLVGRVASARECYERGAEAYLQTGELRKWAAAAGQLAKLDLQQGKIAEFLENVEEIVRVAEDAGNPQSWAWAVQQLAEAFWSIGPPEEAERLLPEVIRVFEAIPDHASVAAAKGDLALARLRQGKVDQALELVSEADRLIADRGILGPRCSTPRIAAAEAFLAGAEQAEGHERSRLLKQAERACAKAIKQGRVDRGCLPAAYRLEGVCYWLKGKAEPARRSWARSVEIADELDARLEAGLTYREVARRTADPGSLSRAEALLDGMERALAERADRRGVPEEHRVAVASSGARIELDEWIAHRAQRPTD